MTPLLRKSPLTILARTYSINVLAAASGESVHRCGSRSCRRGTISTVVSAMVRQKRLEEHGLPPIGHRGRIDPASLFTPLARVGSLLPTRAGQVELRIIGKNLKFFLRVWRYMNRSHRELPLR